MLFLKQVSNRFYFTFGVDPEAIKNGLRLRHVVPATEEEARKVLERMDAENLSLVKIDGNLNVVKENKCTEKTNLWYSTSRTFLVVVDWTTERIFFSIHD